MKTLSALAFFVLVALATCSPAEEAAEKVLDKIFVNPNYQQSLEKEGIKTKAWGARSDVLKESTKETIRALLDLIRMEVPLPTKKDTGERFILYTVVDNGSLERILNTAGADGAKVVNVVKQVLAGTIGKAEVRKAILPEYRRTAKHFGVEKEMQAL